jgi:hypothetical protein
LALQTTCEYARSPMCSQKTETATSGLPAVAVLPDIDVLRCRLARRYALASGRAFTRRRRLLASLRFRSA